MTVVVRNANCVIVWLRQGWLIGGLFHDSVDTILGRFECHERQTDALLTGELRCLPQHQGGLLVPIEDKACLGIVALTVH